MLGAGSDGAPSLKNQMGKVLGKGSIDQPKIKHFVTDIMEGSTEAFRLRRER